jgi:hypothetical protein
MPEQARMHDPIELTHRAFGFLNRRDLDAVMGLLSPTCVCDMSRLGRAVYTGAEAIREFSDDWLGTLYEYGVAVDEIEDLGNGVVRVDEVAHRARTSHGFYETSSSLVGVWDDGLLTQVTLYPDPDEARAAAERLAQERR